MRCRRNKKETGALRAKDAAVMREFNRDSAYPAVEVPTRLLVSSRATMATAMARQWQRQLTATANILRIPHNNNKDRREGSAHPDRTKSLNISSQKIHGESP